MIDKERLLKPRLAETIVEIPGLGQVRVRALSRVELHMLRGWSDTSESADVWVLARALVEPEITEAEALAALKASPGNELDPVFAAVNEMSDRGLGATKSL